jgi:hypothetical protein
MDARLHVLLVASLCLAGCAAQARQLRRDPQGGELLLVGPSALAAVAARTAMVEHCAGRYELQLDGELERRPASDLASSGRVRYTCLNAATEPAPSELARN